VEEVAEKVRIATSAAKASIDNAGVIAALKALRHPKSEFFRNLWNSCPSHACLVPEFFRDLLRIFLCAFRDLCGKADFFARIQTAGS